MDSKTAIINVYTREKKFFALSVRQNIAKISDIADESEANLFIQGYTIQFVHYGSGYRQNEHFLQKYYLANLFIQGYTIQFLHYGGGYRHFLAYLRFC